MYKPSKKTIYLTGAFAAVAGLVGVYSYWNDISYAVCDKVYPEANEGEVRLKDSQGNRYSLLNHGDGKETALYDDNRSVTFHRDNGGNLVWDAGLASLLPTIAAGYYIFHGFNPPTARMDGRTMTYRANNLMNIRHQDQLYMAMEVEEAFVVMRIVEVRKHHL